MATLPEEIWLYIFKFLDLKDLYNCVQICQKWRDVLHSSPSFWRQQADIFLWEHRGQRIAGEFRKLVTNECKSPGLILKAFKKLESQQRGLFERVANRQYRSKVAFIPHDVFRFDYENNLLAMQFYNTYSVYDMAHLEVLGSVEVVRRIYDGSNLLGIRGKLLVVEQKLVETDPDRMEINCLIFNWMSKEKVLTIEIGTLKSLKLEFHIDVLVAGIFPEDEVKVWKLHDLMKESFPSTDWSKIRQECENNSRSEPSAWVVPEKAKEAAPELAMWDHDGHFLYLSSKGNSIFQIYSIEKSCPILCVPFKEAFPSLSKVGKLSFENQMLMNIIDNNVVELYQIKMGSPKRVYWRGSKKHTRGTFFYGFGGNKWFIVANKHETESCKRVQLRDAADLETMVTILPATGNISISACIADEFTFFIVWADGRIMLRDYF